MIMKQAIIGLPPENMEGKNLGVACPTSFQFSLSNRAEFNSRMKNCWNLFVACCTAAIFVDVYMTLLKTVSNSKLSCTCRLNLEWEKTVGTWAVHVQFHSSFPGPFWAIQMP